MLNLSSVTLLCVETRDPALAHWAIEKCLEGTRFAKVVLITSLDRVSERKIGVEYVQAPPMKTTKDYSEFLLSGLDQYISTPHVLIIQWDSFITHPNLWREEFLEYDYIGPVWPHHPDTPVGNGGFSLRSKKLLQAMNRTGFHKRHPEDYCICVDNKAFLEKECDIKIAPAHIAEQFAVERSAWHAAFGFHGFFNFGKVLSDSELQAFLECIPDHFLRGIDAYDLMDDLVILKKYALARMVANRIGFSWKQRKRFMRMKWKLWYLLGQP